MATTGETLPLPGARTLSYDDAGAPDGHPVLYLHGTPDSRLARHPDDGVAVTAGVRLLALDRPGYGGTSALAPDAPRDAFADDVAALLDHLRLPAAALLAWSGGALTALHLAGSPTLADRISSTTIVAGLVPADAYADPDVRAAAPERLGLLEMAEVVPPAEVAEAAAAMIAPYPCDHAVAVEHQREQRSPQDQRLLDGIPGAADRMADALVDAVRDGLAGVEADILDQIEPFGTDALKRITTPIRLLYGEADTVTPPAFGHWYARVLVDVQLSLLSDAGHYLPFSHWQDVLHRARQ